MQFKVHSPIRESEQLSELGRTEIIIVPLVQGDEKSAAQII